MNKDKSCDNCVNNYHGTCEEYGFFKGMGVPVHCEPPYNEACDLWTDDPKKANKWRKWV